MTDTERAIAIIEEARTSHVLWRDHLAVHVVIGVSCSRCTPDVRELVETADEQQRWVDNYDLVLRVLRDQ